MNESDIVVIGGGAAGLMAARTLSQAGLRVILLEARERLGGRIHTVHKTGFTKPVEAGAEFIHGNLPVTFSLLKEAGIRYRSIEGEMWRYTQGAFDKEEDFIENGDLLSDRLKELKEEMTVSAFLDKNFNDDRYASLKASVRGFVEGYDAADINRASALALRQEWIEDDEEQYRPNGGYTGLIGFLENECRNKGCKIFTSNMVKRINWRMGNVSVITTEGTYLAKQAIVTIPVSLLRENAILFTPAIEDKLAAAHLLGYGGVIKLLLQFKDAFWKAPETKKRIGVNIDRFGWLFSDCPVPTWWTQLPDNAEMLTGWLAGPGATQRKDWDDHTLLQEALQSLGTVFKMSHEEITDQLAGSAVFNWLADPFSRGAYSYATPETNDAKKILDMPVDNTLFFAGEALSTGPHSGTVEGALESGEHVARKAFECTQG